MKKVLVFDIWADYAHFKKYFTTMSPLSFSVPPRTVLSGIIGAIAGIDKETNPEIFSKEISLLTLQINKPVKKIKITSNNIKATSLKHLYRYENHKPTNYEFLKNYCLRIFFSHQDSELYNKVKDCLVNHKSFYTPCLGISACLADFSFIGEYEYVTKTDDNFIFFNSLVPVDLIAEIDFQNDNEMQKSVLPNVMKNNREVTEYREFLYDVLAKPIKIKLKENTSYKTININQQAVNFLEM